MKCDVNRNANIEIASSALTFKISNEKSHRFLFKCVRYDSTTTGYENRSNNNKNNKNNNKKLATLSLFKPISSYSPYAKLVIAIEFPKIKTKLFSANGFPRLLKIWNKLKYHWEMNQFFFGALSLQPNDANIITNSSRSCTQWENFPYPRTFEGNGKNVRNLYGLDFI